MGSVIFVFLNPGPFVSPERNAVNVMLSVGGVRS